jgi:trigger factor
LDDYIKNETGDIIGEPIPDETQERIDLQIGNDFEFVYQTGYYPDFTLELNEEINLPYYEISLNTADIDKEIEYYRKRCSKNVQGESIESNDMVKAETKINGEPSEFVFLMDRVPAEQHAVFVGAAKDDEIEVEMRSVFTNEVDLCNMLSIDKEILAELPEKMPVKIVEITRQLPADFDQEFFDKVCGQDKVHDENELRSYIVDEFTKYNEKLSLERLYRDAEKELREKAKINLPLNFLKNYFVFMNKNNDKVDETYIDEHLTELADNMAWNYISNKLLKNNEIKVSEEEVVEEARQTLIRRLSMYGLQNFEGFDLGVMLRKMLNNETEIERVIDTLKKDKLSGLIKEKVTLDKKQTSIAELNALYDAEIEERRESESETIEAESEIRGNELDAKE